MVNALKKQNRPNLRKEQEVSAVLQERERLAREIHDNLGPALSFIQTQALIVKEYIAKNDLQQATNHLQRLSMVAGEASGRLREYLGGLRPSVEWNFFSQLQEYLQHFGELHDFTIQQRITTKRILFTPASGLHILRIVQEALNNSQKYAAADEINLTITSGADDGNGYIQITIVDDGKGFSLSTAGGADHYGLAIMNERAAVIGGTLEIKSKPGQGTQVLLQLPNLKGFGDKIFYTATLKKRC